jgi:hypothetical protein
MFQILREGIDIRVYVQGNCCRIELRGRLTVGREADEACPVTVLDGVLGDLVRVGARRFEIDISHLREIDIFGVKLLKELRRQAGCTLIIPREGMKLEPLLVIEMLTRCDWNPATAA